MGGEHSQPNSTSSVVKIQPVVSYKYALLLAAAAAARVNLNETSRTDREFRFK